MMRLLGRLKGRLNLVLAIAIAGLLYVLSVWVFPCQGALGLNERPSRTLFGNSSMQELNMLFSGFGAANQPLSRRGCLGIVIGALPGLTATMG